MEFVYRNRKYITAITLVSVVSLFLLFNFKALIGTYSQDNFKNTLSDPLHELEYGILAKNAKIVKGSDSVQIEKVSESGFFSSLLINCSLLLVIPASGIVRSKRFWVRRSTLVSLCVRKDE